MKSSGPHESAAVPLSRRSPDVRLLFTVEFLTSAGGNFLQVGIFFYTIHRFHWTLRDNFLLGAAQGVAYVMGAMNAKRLARIWSRRACSTRLYFCMMTVGLVGVMFPFSAVIAVLLPIYAGIAAMSWPILESLVSEGLDSDALGRRIGIYNLMWSGSVCWCWHSTARSSSTSSEASSRSRQSFTASP